MNNYIKILLEHNIQVIDSLSDNDKITVVSEYMRDKQQYIKIEKIRATYKDIYRYLGY